MIKANELRIGNYVYCNDRLPIIIREIKRESILYLYKGKFWYNLEYKYLEPIQLTEEIIKKCGFNEVPDYDEDSEGNSKSCFDLIIDSDKENCEIFYIFFVREEEGIYIQLNGKDEICGNRFKHIKYLHQLQNLYFALTNEELIIQL